MTKEPQSLSEAGVLPCSPAKTLALVWSLPSLCSCLPRGPLLSVSCGAGPEVQGRGSLVLEERAPQMAAAWATNR